MMQLPVEPLHPSEVLVALGGDGGVDAVHTRAAAQSPLPAAVGSPAARSALTAPRSIALVWSGNVAYDGGRGRLAEAEGERNR